MQSLRDKLLKAGLVSQEQVREVEAANKRPSPPKIEPRADGLLPKLPPLPGSKAHQRLEAAKQQELAGKLRQLARGAEIAREEGGRTFHFMTRKGKLRRIDLSDAQAQALEAGNLAIVESPEKAQIEHVLVPSSAAEAILALSQKAVRFWNRPGNPPIGFDEEPS